MHCTFDSGFMGISIQHIRQQTFDLLLFSATPHYYIILPFIQLFRNKKRKKKKKNKTKQNWNQPYLFSFPYYSPKSISKLVRIWVKIYLKSNSCLHECFNCPWPVNHLFRLLLVFYLHSFHV